MSKNWIDFSVIYHHFFESLVECHQFAVQEVFVLLFYLALKLMGFDNFLLADLNFDWVMVEKEDNVFPMVQSGAGVGEILLEPNIK